MATYTKIDKDTDTATFISGASDGDVYIYDLWGGAMTYKEVHDAAEGEVVVDKVDNAAVGQESHSGFAIWRSFLFFDTSSIPVGAVIISAILNLRFLWDYSNIDFYVVIRNGMPNHPHSPLVLGDYYYNNYSGNGGQVSTEGISTVENTDITLNTTGRSWIQKGVGAVTKFALISSRDISETEPDLNSDEDISLYTFEATNVEYRPKLTIIYRSDYTKVEKDTSTYTKTDKDTSTYTKVEK